MPIEIVATDFDGTIVENGVWPDLGRALPHAFRVLRRIKAAGIGLILLTNRSGEELAQAIAFCRAAGIEFDAINDDLPAAKAWNRSRKVYADLYVEDRAAGFPGPEKVWLWVEHRMENEGALAYQGTAGETRATGDR